ncbi:hypothetical protein U9M48_034320 [Paspalum notatum var. saurae]|uniref:CCHC-type domain-containing protein n=1 Tax=Paspalum notatum var. saurae TaxID=547442 RepID=A0AAQ3UCI1_PASNO
MASHHSGNAGNVAPEAVAEGQGDNNLPAAVAVQNDNDPTATGAQGGSNGAESHTRTPQRTPPPPPNPIVELTQNLVRCIEGIAQKAPPPQQGRAQNLMGEFMKLRPTPFAGSHDPLEAHDWIRAIERKLEIINCDEPTKVALATHQLTGAALAWWESYREAHRGQVTWEGFLEDFRKYHVPEAARDLKAEEFRKLKQNTMTMQEYIEKFTTLSRYAPEEVNTNPKKCKCFIRGLNPEIKSIVHSNEAPSFATLINRVIQIEEDKREEKSQLKRKFMEIKSQRQERRFRQKSFGGQVSRGSYGVPPRNTISNPSRFAPTQSSYQTQQYDPRTCFKCGKPGHFQFNCPQQMRPAVSTFSNSINGPKQTSATGNRPTTSTQSGKPPLPPANRARINHVEAQEAQQATGVALGEFLVNSVKATVLFDSGASHSFISSSFVEKHNIPTIPLKKPLLTRTPGADIPCQLGCVGVQILLRGVVFTANLIVIKSKDIDVILGMNRLSSHRGVITRKNKPCT